MTGLAVNVTAVPLHTGFDEAAMVTPTGSTELTVNTTVFDVAGLPEIQGSEEVRIQIIASLFCGIYVYVEFVAPVTTVPFTFH